MENKFFSVPTKDNRVKLYTYAFCNTVVSIEQSYLITVVVIVVTSIIDLSLFRLLQRIKLTTQFSLNV